MSLLVNFILLGALLFSGTGRQLPCTCTPCAPLQDDPARLPAAKLARAAAEVSVVKGSRLILPPSVIGENPNKPREDGWVGAIERQKKRTSRTFYDPEKDVVFASRTPKSLTPLPSMTVEVRPGHSIVMDDVIHAYDIWFEEHHIFDRLSWLGVSMQQDPADAITIQQMLFHVKPDLVIEIGTNTGGGAIFYSSIMRMYNPDAKVVTVDIKPISNWRDGATTGANLTYCDRCILGTEHPFWNDGGIVFIQGKITGNKCQVIDQLQTFVDKATKVLVIEDAAHTRPTVAVHIEALHRFVSVNSYMLVQDTKLTRLFPSWTSTDWGMGPLPAVEAFISTHDNFVVDRRYEYLMYSQHHWGWLRKTRE